MKIIRILFYVTIIVVSVIFVQIKKAEITVKKEQAVESVLSIMTQTGLPITVYKVQTQNFVKSSLYHLLNCGDTHCFKVSFNEKKQFQQDGLVRDPDTNKEIGVISEIPAHPSLNSGLYEVKIKLLAKASNRTNFVKIDHIPLPESIVVPVEAVTQLKEGAFVYVLNNETPEKRTVEVNGIANSQIRILKGLKDGETIVVEGISQISLFDKFRVVGEWKANTKGRRQ